VNETALGNWRTSQRGNRLPQAVRCATRLTLRLAFPVSNQQTAGYLLVDEEQIVICEAYQDVFASAMHALNPASELGNLKYFGQSV